MAYEDIKDKGFDCRTTKEVQEIARRGGIASGKARKEKATMKRTLEMLLDEKNKKGSTYRELATLGLIKGATEGKAENYKLILTILGELNPINENMEDINKGIINIANLLNNPVKNRTEKDINE